MRECWHRAAAGERAGNRDDGVCGGTDDSTPGTDNTKKDGNTTTPTEDPAAELQKAKDGAMGKLQDYQRLVILTEKCNKA